MVDTYGDYILDTGRHEAWERLFHAYIRRSRFQGRDEIVEVGPGRCAFTRSAPDRIIAVDNAPALVDHYKKEGLDIRLGSADDLPLEDGSMDALYSCWLLEHLTDPVPALREARRVLRPGGYALFVVPSVRSLTRGFYSDYTHVRPYNAQSLAQVARAAGFERFAVEHLFWTRGLRRLIPLAGERRTMRAVRIGDVVGRRFGVVNRDNLLFELWA
ncbi:class I SAM-dependent methyltransferase [Actinomadura sp. WMMA1423]|uniref:class I SAM-dependent methyltransferase n=1 Tax=Actinomadura sp. WMMA1423 TaxID=2591108 RepID=UPI0011461C63|nr:class I SAM-dependent methyltransferase [Actinomadura sp. WMMA1423]